MNDELQHMLNEMDEKNNLFKFIDYKRRQKQYITKMGFERNELKHYHKVLKTIDSWMNWMNCHWVTILDGFI